MLLQEARARRSMKWGMEEGEKETHGRFRRSGRDHRDEV